MASKKVEYQDDPELTARFRAKMDRIRHAETEGLTIADRLMRRAYDQKFTIPFPVEGGEPVPVEVRMPLAAEMDELVKTLEPVKNPVERKEMNRRLCELLGSLCLDESLDAAFFESGALTLPDLRQIRMEILLENKRRIVSAQSFRPESAGQGIVPAVSEPGKVPP